MSPRTRFLAAIVAGTALTGVAACGSDDDHAKTTASTRSATKPRPLARPTPAPPAARLPLLGTSQTIAASSVAGRPKTTLRVKASHVYKRLTPTAFQRGALPKGMHFVGVRISLTNIGRWPWSGKPGDVSTLVTSADTQAGKATSAGGCGGAFSLKTEISAGERQRGCLVFILPKRQRPKLFQFSPDYPATPPLQWALTRAAQPAPDGD